MKLIKLEVAIIILIIEDFDPGSNFVPSSSLFIGYNLYFVLFSCPDILFACLDIYFGQKSTGEKSETSK